MGIYKRAIRYTRAIKEQQKKDYAQIQKRRQTANILNIPK